MKYDDEESIKKELDIESWRNLSRDKVVRFAAMMPDMDTEVALKIIDQFPAFKEFAEEALNTLERAHSSTLDANAPSQEHVHKAWQEIRSILRGQLENTEDLSWEQRRYLIEQIQDTGRQQAHKDTENKKFLDTLLGKVTFGAGMVVVGALVFVGAKVIADNGPDGITKS